MLRVEITRQFPNLAEAIDFLEIHKSYTAEGELVFKEKDRQLKILGFPLSNVHELDELAKALQLPPYSVKNAVIELTVSLSQSHILRQVKETQEQGDFLNEKKEEEALRNERRELENWLKEYGAKQEKEIGKGKGIAFIRARLAEEGIKLIKVNSIETLREAKKALQSEGKLL